SLLGRSPSWWASSVGFTVSSSPAWYRAQYRSLTRSLSVLPVLASVCSRVLAGDCSPVLAGVCSPVLAPFSLACSRVLAGVLAGVRAGVLAVRSRLVLAG